MGKPGETVRVFAIGSAGAGVDLAGAARMVNAGQRRFTAVVDSAVSIPDGSHQGITLDDETVQSLFAGNGMQAAVTLNALSGNYFSRRYGVSRVVVSTYQTEEPCALAGRSQTEYVAQQLATQWLYLRWLQRADPGERLWHDDTRECIFDFVGYKPMIRHKLQRGHVCDGCRHKLAAIDGLDVEVAAVEKVLQNIQVPSFTRATHDALANPVFSLILGGVLGGIAVNVLSSALAAGFDRTSWRVLAVVALLGVTAVVVNFLVVRSRYRRSRQ